MRFLILTPVCAALLGACASRATSTSMSMAASTSGSGGGTSAHPDAAATASSGSGGAGGTPAHPDGGSSAASGGGSPASPDAGSPSVRFNPAPAGEPLSPNFTVTVQGQSVPVYTTGVRAEEFTAFSSSFINASYQSVPWSNIAAQQVTTSQAAFASFDLTGGSATITVGLPTIAHPLSAAVIRPLSSGIVPTLDTVHNTVSLVVPPQTYGQQLTLEINGDYMSSLHLFVNPWDDDPPDTNDPSVMVFAPGSTYVEGTTTIDPSKTTLYFLPGEHYVTGSLNLATGQAIYLPDGAVIKGTSGPPDAGGNGWMINMGLSSKLYGRGIIDGQASQGRLGGNVQVWAYDPSSTVLIDGVILRDASGWNLPVNGNDVTVNNVKVLGWYHNSDGIDVCNSQNVTVQRSFFRTFDDLVVVKATSPSVPGKNVSGTSNVLVQNCVLWNELAHALSIGGELEVPPPAPSVENVTFQNCDVIHDTGNRALLGVLDTWPGISENIVYDHVNVEESLGVIDLWLPGPYGPPTSDPGGVASITFSNITAPAQGASTVPRGNIWFVIDLSSPVQNPFPDGGPLIRGVVFKNFSVTRDGGVAGVGLADIDEEVLLDGQSVAPGPYIATPSIQ